MAESEPGSAPGAPFDRLVVGVDGSVAAARALGWAVDRLAPGGIAHVVHATDEASGLDAVRRRVQGAWSEPARSADVELRFVVQVGDPDEVIAECGREHAADAIVVGAHGAGAEGRRSRFLGGVVRKLLVESRIPLVVHHHADGGRESPVVGCVGYGPSADAVVEWAADYAARSDHPLTLLHAVSHRPLFPFDSPVDTLGSYLGPGVDTDWARAELDDLRNATLSRLSGLDISTKVAQGSAIHAIVEAGSGDESSGPAEIVVIGRGTTPIAGRLPSVRLHQVITRAQCPTAIVPACRTADD